MTEPASNPPPIDYRNPVHARAGKRSPSPLKILGWTVGTIFAALLVVATLMPGLSHPREMSNRVKCASNLRQLGMAIILYANDNRGRLPPDFGALLATQDITSEVFTCPSSEMYPAKAPTTQQVITTMLNGDHLSYAYVGGKNIASQTSDEIVAFDLELHVPKEAVTGTGINVLLGDYSAVFVNEKVAKAIQARFNAGVRPIRLSDCDPTVRPATNPTGTEK